MSEGRELIVTYEDGLQIVTFNRPQKLNSITLDTYRLLVDALEEAVKRADVKITVVTGKGKYFSSGNDFSSPFGGDIEGTVRTNVAVVSKFVNVLLDHPKLLVAVVNGPAIGIAVTMLSLFDIVYASENATFQTPFTSLGICAEGCSSFMFPRIMGKSLASKMLYFNYKMSAREAVECGFVAQLFKSEDISKAFDELKTHARLPLNSFIASKKLMRSPELNTLKAVNAFETETLVERFLSEDFVNALMEMMSRKKSKL